MRTMAQGLKNPNARLPIALLVAFAIVIVAYLSLVLLIAWHQNLRPTKLDQQPISRILGQ